ncbi:hypothetical protein HPB47_008509 [Ixodes persulcatus]|uniref:Uncharacterized protein n=1 Tax=Ixodes persulcatus TaxID=34615 RepID=A0AC60P4S6_IXOPE|nr:hypothetical protein HPB47_008509 [Ixodes persulcatus]
MVIGEEVIPENITTLLSKGPKNGIEPSIPAHELVALNRRVASKAEKEDQERCLLEGQSRVPDEDPMRAQLADEPAE